MEQSVLLFLGEKRPGEDRCGRLREAREENRHPLKSEGAAPTLWLRDPPLKVDLASGAVALAPRSRTGEAA